MCKQQGAINVDDLQQHVHDFSLLALDSLKFISSPSKILIIGLGAGIIPRNFFEILPEVHIDIIEIDPEIISIAKRFFFFEPNNRMVVHRGDAYVIVHELIDKYDIVVMDAFMGNYIPFPLMSVEFIRQLKKIMADKAVVSINCSHFHPSFSSQVNTYREVFGNNIYRLDGIRNSTSTTLYVLKGDLEAENLDDVFAFPSKVDITPEIKNAKIFTVLRP